MSGDRGEGLRGNREVSQLLILGVLRRGDLEEGAHGNATRPRITATEPEASEAIAA
jgi:hypothetical protein